MLTAKPPEPVVQIDMAGIVQALADYQIQRDVKSRHQMNLVQENMAALNDLLNLAFEHREVLMQIAFLEPMHAIVKRILSTCNEAVYAHNDDAANLLGAVRTIQGRIGEAMEAYERQRRG